MRGPPHISVFRRGSGGPLINHVKALAGKGLTVSQVNQLVAAAKQIQVVPGCSLTTLDGTDHAQASQPWL